MLEIRIHGRGGQGGVTLAKLISTIRFLKGDSVQAFGLYAAERSGAPLQAFCRYSPDPITNRNLIYEPDHIVVLDPTLIGMGITTGLKAGGWILLNTPDEAARFATQYPGYRIAVIDATAIARANNLGTQSVPIVNTALAGAVGKLLGEDLPAVHAALEHLGFVGGNLTAASTAFETVQTIDQPIGTATVKLPTIPRARIAGLVDGNVGTLPKIRTGDWATLQPQRQQLVPPCNDVCPAGNDVQGFLDALAKEDPDLALETLLRTTPFPAVCGRVCPAPCMQMCNRINLDTAVNVRELERYAAEHGEFEVTKFDERTETIAIIGSGPAGLSAAYHLARLGYQVTILEAAPQLGGLLRTGIPSYRLPRDVLDAEIAQIIRLGVTVKTGNRIDRATLLALANDFDGVLVATGLQELRDLHLGGVGGDDEMVEQGIDFLERANRDEERVDGEDVIVVGGGNTAFDAARSCLRLGASSVRMVYRRTRNEMPAIAEEIDEGIEEGIEIDFLTQPIRIAATADVGRYTLTCNRMELGAPDASGRRRPVEIAGSEFHVEGHRVILALGQSAELSIFPEGTEMREGEKILGVLEKPLFAVGDLANNDGTVSAAIGSGRRAALHIHETIAGEILLAGAHDPDRVIRAESMNMHLIEGGTRCEGATLPAAERRTSFDEVHDGLADPAEALRCMSCGVCNECDRCVTYCPEGVLKREGHEFIFDYAYCKGCGVCQAECPRNVIYMAEL